MLCLLLVLLNFPFVESGYQFNDGKEASSINFRMEQNLIIIPVTLNDSISLNLILDTGTTSLILFGPKTAGLKNIHPNKKISICGYGDLNLPQAILSFPNKIAIGDIVGNGIGAALLDKSEIYKAMPFVDGIIGYELFVRFCVKIDYPGRTITFYDQIPAHTAETFQSIKMETRNLRPEILSKITFIGKKQIEMHTLIDTGSSLGLVLFSGQRNKFPAADEVNALGIGLRGRVSGTSLFVKSYEMGGIEVNASRSKLVEVEDHHHNSSSLGGDFLRKYVIMFHYPSSSFFIKL